MKGWPLFAVYARIVAGNTRGRAGTCAPGCEGQRRSKGDERTRGREGGKSGGGGGGTTKVPIRANECLLVKQTRFSTLSSLILVPARILNDGR